MYAIQQFCKLLVKKTFSLWEVDLVLGMNEAMKLIIIIIIRSSVQWNGKLAMNLAWMPTIPCGSVPVSQSVFQGAPFLPQVLRLNNTGNTHSVAVEIHNAHQPWILLKQSNLVLIYLPSILQTFLIMESFFSYNAY